MLPVLAGAVPPLWAGDIYCTVIHLCHQLADLAPDAGLDRCARRAGRAAVGDVHVRRRHPGPRAPADQRRGRLGRRGGGAGRRASLVGSHGWLAAEGFYELGTYAACAVTLPAPGRPSPGPDLGVEPQPGEALLRRPRGTPRGAGRRCGPPRRAGTARAGAPAPPAVEVALRARDARSPAPCAELEADRRVPRDPRPAGAGRPSRGLPALHRRAGRPLDPPGGRPRRSTATSATAHATARVHEHLAGHDGRWRPAPRRPSSRPRWRSTASSAPSADVDRLTPRGPRAGSRRARWRCSPASPPAPATGRWPAHLVISDKTVSRHLANIFAKAGVRAAPPPRPGRASTASTVRTRLPCTVRPIRVRRVHDPPDAGRAPRS